MRRTIVLPFCVFFLLAWTKTILALEAHGILDGIRKAYPQDKIIVAHYERSTFTKVGSVFGEGQEDKARGKIYFCPPSKLRLEQELPQKEVMVTDGQKIYWHIVPKDELYIYDFKNYGASLSAITMAFQGLLGMEEEFQISIQKDNSGHTLLLTPKQPQSEFSEIGLKLGQNYKITNLKIRNIAGGLTEFVFTNQEELSSAPRGLFEYKVPEGVKVIEGQ